MQSASERRDAASSVAARHSAWKGAELADYRCRWWSRHSSWHPISCKPRRDESRRCRLRAHCHLVLVG